MKSIGVMDRQDLLRILDYIENTLKAHWADHEGFHNLQERILMLRMILEQTDDSALQDPETYKALVVQITTLELLMKKYQVRVRRTALSNVILMCCLQQTKENLRRSNVG